MHSEELIWFWIIVVLGYIAAFSLSGVVVRKILRINTKTSRASNGTEASEQEKIESETSYLGSVIGKCENSLALTFILANEVTGLALVFTAKSILRADEVKKNPHYYLGGTLVNFCFSVLMGFLIRFILGAVTSADLTKTGGVFNAFF